MGRLLADTDIAEHFAIVPTQDWLPYRAGGLASPLKTGASYLWPSEEKWEYLTSQSTKRSPRREEAS